MEVVATALSIDLHQVQVRGPGEFDNAVAAMARQRVDAFVVLDDPMLIAHAAQLARLAASKRLLDRVQRVRVDGGLLGYAVNFPEIWRRAAVFVDRIFKGGKPSELPVEQATKLDFVINLKTAKALGLTMPQSVPIRANQVLE